MRTSFSFIVLFLVIALLVWIAPMAQGKAPDQFTELQCYLAVLCAILTAAFAKVGKPAGR